MHVEAETTQLSLFLCSQSDQERVTVFVFNFTDHSEEEVRLRQSLQKSVILIFAQVQLARSAHLRLKTLRHPNILKYIDGIEVTFVLLCFQNSFSIFAPLLSISSQHVSTWSLRHAFPLKSSCSVKMAAAHFPLPGAYTRPL